MLHAARRPFYNIFVFRSVKNKSPYKKVTKPDFILALSRLGLVLTHGQATTLAVEYHGDYSRFFAVLGGSRRFSEVGPECD